MSTIPPAPQDPAGWPQQPPGAVSESDAKMWSLGAHLGGFLLSWVVPLVIYLVYRDRSPFIRQHAAEALNFQIALFVAYVVSVLLMVVLVGFFTFAATAVLSLIFAIMASVAAANGQPYRYPLTLRIIS